MSRHFKIMDMPIILEVFVCFLHPVWLCSYRYGLVFFFFLLLNESGYSSFSFFSQHNIIDISSLPFYFKTLYGIISL